MIITWISGLLWACFLALIIVQICKWARNRGVRRSIDLMDHRIGIMEDLIEENPRTKADMNILSKRITNAFEYVTAVMAAHELMFHPKAAPKKPAKKNKRRTPEQINGLIKMVRKA